MLAPFNGLLFNPSVVGDVGAATSPPYDVISAEEQLRLEQGSAYNMVRLLLPGAERYQDAGRLLEAWRRSEALVQDPTERFYIYEMEWIAEGEEHVAKGVVGALLVEELGTRVLPHEETMSGIRADRYAVLDATQANLDPIVALSSSTRLIDLLEAPGAPRVEVTDPEGVIHRLAEITDGDAIADVRTAVRDGTLSIADGHHRYTTALAYAGDHGPGPWSRIMAVVAPARGSGLEIAPYHRWFPTSTDVGAAASAFTVSPVAPVPPTNPGALVVVTGQKAILLTPKDRTIATLTPPLGEASAAVARDILYPLVGLDENDARYTPSADEAVDRARAGGTAVLVAPVTEAAIAAASDAAVRFPQKTTYFRPKPRAGLVLRTF